MTVAAKSMTIARFHRAVFGSNISSPQLTHKRLERIGIKLTKDTVLTAVLAAKARAAYERYKEKNPRYVQRVQSAAGARAARQGRTKGTATDEHLVVPIPAGSRELDLPLHVIPERTRAPSAKSCERKPRTISEAQDRDIAVMLLQAAIALINR